MDQLEKRFGRFAIPDLTVKFLFLQAIGYVLFEMLKLDGMRTYCEMNPYMILHHFQIWRLVTWLMIPTDGGLFLFIITSSLAFSLRFLGASSFMESQEEWQSRWTRGCS